MSWLERKTDDGRWTYGYGEYQEVKKNLTRVVYYIWAIDPNGQKRMGGLWTDPSIRDAYYFTVFEPKMNSLKTDKERVEFVTKTTVIDAKTWKPSVITENFVSYLPVGIAIGLIALVLLRK